MGRSRNSNLQKPDPKSARLPVAPYAQKIGEQERSPEMYNISSNATHTIL